ncbi:hypothetical protein ET445_05500 [Agromyces protaetiae]|uniref:Htaa domain-containing protein n=1 Tax=Agromyces protaetiae TaxID=2509455 RepID=A0A4P6FGB6_9MICO|nr:HtaA domain-containing protein [Agromyces protaetiae]QAY72877.1 hypothetical protein ET445_05500 [Agromyces protaetiae]
MKTPSNPPSRPLRALLAGLVTLAVAFGGSLSTVGPAIADEIASPDAAVASVGAPADAAGAEEAPADEATGDEAPGDGATLDETPEAPEASEEGAATAEGEPEASGFAPAVAVGVPSVPGVAAEAAEAEAPSATPTITVSKTFGLDAHGETVTVTGSGFVPGADTTSARPPIAGKFGGVYVAFGAFDVNWKPSTGAPSTARPTVDVKWGVHAEDLAKIGGPSKGGFVVNEDGTFETTLTLSYDAAKALADGHFGIYTYPGGGAKAPSFETFEPIAFAPAVFVDRTAGLDPFDDTVTVNGVGFTPTAATIGSRPPLAGKFSGAYVAFGAFAENWKPSAGVAATARPTGDVKWGVHAADIPAIGGPTAGGIAIADNGTFTTQLKVAATYAKMLADGRYGVYTYPGGGAKEPTFETYTPVSFAPAVQVSKTTGLNAEGDTVTVRGAGFLPSGADTNGKRPPLAGKFGGAYVVFGSFAENWKPSAGAPSGNRKTATQKWALNPADVATVGGAAAGAIEIGAGGTFETTLDVSEFTGALKDGRYGVYTYPGSGATYAPFETATLLTFGGAPTGPTGPTTPQNPAPAPAPIAGGSLSWAVSNSFVDYVTGSIAKGQVSVSGGATRSGGVFQFGQSGGSFDQSTGRGSADYSGAVRFTGHAGALDLTFANPTLRVVSATEGVLNVSVDGSRVDLARVDLGAASKSSVGGATRFAGAPTTLLASGVSAFEGYYGAGQQLAPVTAVVGSPAAAPAGSTGTVVTASASAAPREVPATPPATTGVELDAPTLAALAAGEQVTVTVGGFAPGETGIQVVVYSTPVVLARDLVADASGVVRWTGAIPATLEAGVHTLTFQGSVAKGVQFTVAAADRCAVDAATLSWGFKKSFLTYLESGIANGTWTVADGATDDGTVFAFAAGTGSYDAKTGRGAVVFPGSVHFTGHDGALDTTIANPGLDFTGTGDVFLTLDVHGTTQEGAPIEAKGVRFAELDLSSGFESGDDGVTGTAIPAVLTAEGAAAFGTYPEGEALDPVTFSLPLAADCALVVPAADTETVEAADDDAPTVEPISAAPSLAWLVWAGIALLVIVLAALAFVLVRRARNKTA